MTSGERHPASFRRGDERRRQANGSDREQRAAVIDRRIGGLEWVLLFRGADQAAVREAIGEAEVLALQVGDILLTPGEANDTIYLILAGQLGACLGNPAAPETVIPLGPGECLGELSAIDGKPVSALVKALTDARVLRLSQDVFWNRLMAVPGVARNLMAVLAERMRRSTQAMLESQRRQIELDYLRQELEVARQLQQGMLPMQRPLFPDRRDLEIAGMMEAASSIGGDLFDAFFVDEQRLFFCIGDVSGHGIPAAMFMARAVSLMRLAAFGVDCPGALLAQINDQLCAGNDANMFITLFCGFLEVDTGRLLFANGGHLAPLQTSGGTVGKLPIPKGTIIGVIPGIAYARSEVVLKPGEALLCYTDGVTEAQTAAGEEFSESRLLDLLVSLAGQPLETVLAAVRREVAEFSGDLHLADDCTLLALRRPQG